MDMPHTQALANIIAEAMKPQFGRLEDALAKVCESVAQRNSTAGGGGGGGGSCDPASGKCCSLESGGQKCGKCKGHDVCGGKPLPEAITQQMQRLYNGLPPDCYLSCTKIDPCLMFFWASMAERFTPQQIMNIMRLDPSIVLINKFIGKAGDFVDFPTNPLTGGQKTLLRQYSKQQGPWRPGAIRARPDWDGAPHPGAVSITWYLGPKDLKDIPAADVDTVLTQVGESLDLSSYETNNDCCLTPWPLWMGCESSPIPDPQAAYVKIEVSNQVGGDKLRGLSLEVLKAGTRECDRVLKICS